jgi:hypothetical protein
MTLGKRPQGLAMKPALRAFYYHASLDVGNIMKELKKDIGVCDVVTEALSNVGYTKHEIQKHNQKINE